MKYVKAAAGLIAGVPLGVLVIVGGVVGISVNAFKYGYLIIGERWLDKLSKWTDV